MILAIDVGNSHVVLGSIEDGKILNVIRIKTDPKDTWAEYAIKIDQLFGIFGFDQSRLEGAVVASVVPPVTAAITEAVKKITGKESLVVGPGIKTGLNLRIDDPSTVGADLVVGGVAAIKYYGTPCIVLDMGTATTITVIDGNKSFIGGAILPGVDLSYSALASGTSLLPAISITAPEKVVSTNTVDCMRSGAVYGTASMIDGMIDRIEDELGEHCSVVATGGLSNHIVPCCRHKIVLDDELLLKGLWALWEKNAR
ncbi:MAG: type III pantothenate kinase [Oscillospiraceae bacterium]|nr:type III pantothenate kinase [Oscillospiraceae bacterium]